MTLNQSIDESELNLLPSSSMKGRRRRSRWNEVYRLLLKPQTAFILISTCIMSCLCFSAALYSNIMAVKVLFSSPQPYRHSQAGNAIYYSPIKSREKLSVYDQNIVYKDFNYLKPESLTYKAQKYSKEITILYRFPKQRAIKALLLIFHGCGRSAQDWFHTIERQRIIGAAIDLGYACLAFQATDKIRRCWSSEINPSINEDIQMVNQGLEDFYKEHPKLESLPRYTFGGSSGGIFSSIFVINSRYPVQGQILFISIVHPDILDEFIRNKKYPATAWIYMVRDREFASESRINSSIKIFIQENIPHITYKIEPICLKPSTFHERIPTITDGTSHYLYYRLQQNKWLDEQNCLIYNPRRINTWQTFIYQESNDTKTTEYLNNLEKHKEILPDFLNTIYGEHEISFERSYEALKWLQTISNKDSDLLS